MTSVGDAHADVPSVGRHSRQSRTIRRLTSVTLGVLLSSAQGHCLHSLGGSVARTDPTLGATGFTVSRDPASTRPSVGPMYADPTLWSHTVTMRDECPATPM